MEEARRGSSTDFGVSQLLEAEEKLVVERNAVGRGGRERVERVGEDGQSVVATVPVTWDGVKVTGMDPEVQAKEYIRGGQRVSHGISA